MADNIYDAILKQIADYQPTLQAVLAARKTVEGHKMACSTPDAG
jgi:hypothetical protein